MTPSRMAAFVLVAFVLLPIRADVFACPPEPLLDVEFRDIAHSTPRVDTEAVEFDHRPGTSFEVSAEAKDELAKRERVKCRCLYIDWWYDMGGLWVCEDCGTDLPSCFNAESQFSRKA